MSAPASPAPHSTLAAHDDATRLAGAVATILGLPQIPKRLEAIACFPGLGEIVRDEFAVNTFLGGKHSHLLLAGENPGEGRYNRSIKNLRGAPWNIPADISDEQIITQVYTDNTKTQAEWLVDQVQKLGIQSVGLCVTPWHLPRAYLTTLSAMLRAGTKFELLPLVVPVDFRKALPGTGNPVTVQLPGELGRIPKYQPGGDVATLEQLEEYLGWLWDQPILTDLA